MKATLLLTLSAICLLNSGCTLSDNLLRTSVVQPIQYCNYWDVILERHQFRKMARRELERARCIARAESDDYSCAPFSIDEERGFEDGFVDFLIYGGTGNPPPLPPRRYWWSGCESLDGCGAIQDWFRGFQHGAAVAQASGYRGCVTVPLSDTLTIDTLPLYMGQLSDMEHAEPVTAIGGDLEDTATTEIRAEIPELPASALPSEYELPAPVERLPAPIERLPAPVERLPNSPEPWPQADPAPAFESSDASGTARSNGTNPMSPSRREYSTANDLVPSSETAASADFHLARASDLEPPSKPGTRSTTDAELPSVGISPPLASAERSVPNRLVVPSPPRLVAPALPQPSPTQGVVLYPELIERRMRSPLIRNLPEPPTSPSLSATQNAPIESRLPEPENGAPERKMAPLVQPGPLSGVEGMRSAVPAKSSAVERTGRNKTIHVASGQKLVQPRWTMNGGVLLLLAGGFFFVYRQGGSFRFLSQQHLLPQNLSRRANRPPFEPPLSTRWDTKICEPTSRTRDRVCFPSLVASIVALVVTLMTGCSSLTNPVLNGIPVRKLPTELLSRPHRESMQTVPLSLLRQKQPEHYILAAGDVMGVFISGVFPPTLADQALTTPPVYFPSQIDPLGSGLPPALGYPVTIRSDGTLALPLVDPVLLDGLTVEEANERVRNAYVDKGILQPGRESVMLTLMQPRQIRVLVFRQEVGGFSAGGNGDISSNNIKQGTGHVLDLRAYENDVVNALANTGGLPGQDSYSGIFIFRGGQSNLEFIQQLQSVRSGVELSELSDLAVKTDYIPTRWPPGEPLPFKPEDAILNEGDVVLLEARINDRFYTAGLLPAGERILPRDYDLDVVEAVVQVSGTLVNGAFGGNNFNGLLIQKGIGNPNPSAVNRDSPDPQWRASSHQCRFESCAGRSTRAHSRSSG